MMLPLRALGAASFILCALAALPGCGSTVDTSSSSGGQEGCAPSGMSTLPGVHIDITAKQCTFSLSDPAATITIPYQVAVDQDTGGVIPRAQDAGQCGQPGPSGLITFEQVDGDGQKYCLCNTGKCAPPSGSQVTLKQGSYPAKFTWSKNNWLGPSDTGNPEGAPFPVGDYTLTVSAVGSIITPDSETPFSVTGTMPIHLVP
jgi:hypothetical protein